MARILIVSADRTTSQGWAANLGDAFLTDTLKTALEGAGHHVVAADFGDRRVPPDEPRTRLFGLSGLLGAIRAAEFVVLGGGTMLQDDVGRGWGGLPRLAMVVSWSCRLMNRRCVFFGVGCEPGSRLMARFLLRLAVWRRTVWARETHSELECRALGCRDVRLGADVCLLGEPARSTRRTGGALVALARGDGPLLTAKSVEQLQAAYGNVSFIRMDQRVGDGDGEDLGVPTNTIPGPMSWRTALKYIANADVVIASRMHALYARLLVGGPAVAVSNRTKVIDFAEEFMVPRVLQVADVINANPSSDAGQVQLRRARARAWQAFAELLQLVPAAESEQ